MKMAYLKQLQFFEDFPGKLRPYYKYISNLQYYYLNHMLLVDSKTVHLKRPIQKMLHAYPTSNDSICFLGILSHRRDILTHLDAKTGQIIQELQFTENVDSFGALSETEVMVLETRKNNILVWRWDHNNQNHTKINIPFHFATVETDQSKIQIFPDRNLVCIVENGRYNNNKFRLSYFHYPLKQNQQPDYVFESDSVWTYEHLIRKGNNDSMICWFRGRHDDGFQFRTFDLRQFVRDQEIGNECGQYRVHKFQNNIGKKSPNDPKAEVAIVTMWQMTQNKFMLVTISNLSSTQEDVNNNYVYDAIDNNLRPSKFNFGKYNDLTIDQYNFGSTCMFKTFNFENGAALKTPVYFINNETEEIIATEEWECSYLYKYNFAGYDGNLILECMYENANVSEITINSKKILEPSEITAHFLEGVYEKWDQGLIYEVIKLLPKDKS